MVLQTEMVAADTLAADTSAVGMAADSFAADSFAAGMVVVDIPAADIPVADLLVVALLVADTSAAHYCSSDFHTDYPFVSPLQVLSLVPFHNSKNILSYKSILYNKPYL